MQASAHSRESCEGTRAELGSAIDLERDLAEWAEHAKLIVVTEYGADAVAGLHSLDGSLWTEEFQVGLLAMYHRVFDRQQGGCRRARVELRRLPDCAWGPPGRRQQEGRLHP
jgi:hypothetical protein